MNDGNFKSKQFTFTLLIGVPLFEGSRNVAFSRDYEELDGNLTTCKNTATNQTSYAYMYKLTLGAEYVISKINIDYKYGS